MTFMYKSHTKVNLQASISFSTMQVISHNSWPDFKCLYELRGLLVESLNFRKLTPLSFGKIPEVKHKSEKLQRENPLHQINMGTSSFNNLNTGVMENADPQNTTLASTEAGPTGNEKGQQFFQKIINQTCK